MVGEDVLHVLVHHLWSSRLSISQGVPQSKSVLRVHQRCPRAGSNSVGFDKHPEIEGFLAGIKGQYLIFDDNRVLNIRKHNGYRVTMT